MRIIIENGQDNFIEISEDLEPTWTSYQITFNNNGEEHTVGISSDYTMKELASALKYIISNRD